MKKINKVLLLLLLLIFAVSALNPVMAAISDEDNYSFSQDDIRKELKKKFEFDYKPYLSGEKKLDFQPDRSLFQRIYYTISLKYIKPVENKDLANGVMTEVKRLLSQAKINPSELSKVPSSGIPMEEIVKIYGDRIDPNLIRYACIRGMLDALDDPHSVFLLPEDYTKLTESMEGGNFTGIGVFVTSDPDNYNWLTVSEPIEGTPAYEAGLMPGDIIIAVDGKSTKGEYIDLSVKRIRGPEGKKVVLTISRNGVEKPFDVPIVRRFIHVSSTRAEMLQGGIGYIKLRQYGNETGKELEQSIQELNAKGARAIILDVRNNPGGLINAARDVCSKFLEAGTPVVSTVNKGNQRQVIRTTGEMVTNVPMVVLVNELSASASEITAGALRDSGRAKLIGTRTYGKGSVQELTPVQGTGGAVAALKLTVALFFTPSGVKINGQGLQPDIEVPQDVKDATPQRMEHDKQLQKAVQYLRSQLGS